MTIAPSDPQPDDVVAHEMQDDSSFIIHMQKGSVKTLSTNNDSMKETDGIAEKPIRYTPPQDLMRRLNSTVRIRMMWHHLR